MNVAQIEGMPTISVLTGASCTRVTAHPGRDSEAVGRGRCTVDYVKVEADNILALREVETL
jgi:hypothetical protein